MTTDPELKSKLYYYIVHVSKVYDGDTFTVDIDLGLGTWHHDQTIRLWKLNTPEVKGKDRERGLEVRDFVRGLILDKEILLRTIIDKRGEERTEKFGRLLGEAFVTDDLGKMINLNDLLLEKGMAKPMRGDGTMEVAGAALAPGLEQWPDAIACPLCGEQRSIDAETGTVAACPNCLDISYSLIAG